MHAFLRLIPVAVVAATTAVAQCQFTSLATQGAGASGNFQSTGLCAIAALPIAMQPTLDTAACALRIDVPALHGVCGVDVPLRLLALATASGATPLPEFGPGCTMWLQPAAVLLSNQGSEFVLPIPPGLPPVTVLAQAAVVQTVLSGPPHVTLSEAMALTLR